MGKKKAAKPEQSGTPASDATAAPAAPKTFQVFERMKAMRSQLRLHEANPRQIDSHAFKKLRENLRKVGLVTSLIVNRRDQANAFPPAQHGQLVIIGGHQRCRAMDELRKYNPETRENDYEIPIDVVSVPAGREREMIVFLNNNSAMGSWDYSLLSDLLTSPGVDPLATGFDRLELSQLLDSGIIEQLFGQPSPQAAAEAPVLDAIAQIAADSKAYQQQNAPPVPTGQVSPSLTGNPPPASQTAPPAQGDDYNSVESIKGRRYDFRDKTADAGDSGHILTIVADSSEQLEAFLQTIALPPEPFVSLVDFCGRLSEATGADFDSIFRDEGIGSAPDLQDSPDPA